MPTRETFAADPARLSPLLPGGEFNGPLLWWNHSLTCGGVERQILATAKSLARSRLDLELLVEDLTPGRGDAFLERVRPYCQKISCIFEETEAIGNYAAASLEAVESHFSGLLPVRRRLIAMYAAYFARMRPKLVQVWNADYIHVALAALLAGVPNILMRCASLSPGYRFPRGVESVNDELAKKAFQYLLSFPSLILTGISSRARQDYAEWLNIPAAEIRSTPNAFAPAEWGRSSGVSALRKKLGIPEGAPVIGGMFRFAPIKDPELWVAAAGAALGGESRRFRPARRRWGAV